VIGHAVGGFLWLVKDVVRILWGMFVGCWSIFGGWRRHGFVDQWN